MQIRGLCTSHYVKVVDVRIPWICRDVILVRGRVRGEKPVYIGSRLERRLLRTEAGSFQGELSDGSTLCQVGIKRTSTATMPSFVWALGIQTRVPRLACQAPVPTRPFPQTQIWVSNKIPG